MVSVDIVDVEHEGVRDAADAARALLQLLPRLGAIGCADDDHGFFEHQLGVGQLSFHDDLLPDLEAEGVTKPVDGSKWIVVVDASAQARPARWGRFHWHPSALAVRGRGASWFLPTAGARPRGS